MSSTTRIACSGALAATAFLVTNGSSVPATVATTPSTNSVLYFNGTSFSAATSITLANVTTTTLNGGVFQNSTPGGVLLGQGISSAATGSGLVVIGPNAGAALVGGGTPSLNATLLGSNAGQRLAASGDTGTVVVGYLASNNNVSGVNNTTVGAYSGRYLLGGTCTYVGAFAGQGNSGGSTSAAAGNTAIGYRALVNLSSGQSNIAVGDNAATAITVGSYNIVIGGNSTGGTLIGGASNVVIGAAANCSDVSNQVAIGTSATANGSGSIAIGHGATGAGADTCVIGNTSLASIRAGADNTCALGVVGTRFSNVYTVLLNGGAVTNTTTFVSLQGSSGSTNSNVTNCVALGSASALTLGSALNATGVYVGTSAGRENAAGTSNTYVGDQAGYHQLGSSNTLLGFQAGAGAVTTSTGSRNVAIGAQALLNVTTGASNVAIGGNGTASAGGTLTSGSNNVVVGDSADVSAANVTNEITIGSGATGNGTNTCTLGNASIASIQAGSTAATVGTAARPLGGFYASATGTGYLYTALANDTAASSTITVAAPAKAGVASFTSQTVGASSSVNFTINNSKVGSMGLFAVSMSTPANGSQPVVGTVTWTAGVSLVVRITNLNTLASTGAMTVTIWYQSFN